MIEDNHANEDLIIIDHKQISEELSLIVKENDKQLKGSDTIHLLESKEEVKEPGGENSVVSPIRDFMKKKVSSFKLGSVLIDASSSSTVS